MGIHINFSDVPDREALPAGVYPAVVSSCEDTVSNSSEFNYLKWEFALGGDKFSGRKLWMNTSMSPKALWKLRDTLIGLGVTKAQLASPDFELDLLQFVNMPCEIVVSQDMYEGQITNRVDSVRKAGSGSAATAAAAPKRRV